MTDGPSSIPGYGGPIALLIIGGCAIGFVLGQPTIGFLIGTGLGLTLALTAWWRGRPR